jgi:hypothetical protein
MTSADTIRGLARIWLAVWLAVCVAVFPAVLAAGERAGEGRGAAKPAEEVEMFAGMEKGQIAVQVFPNGALRCNVVIKNKTDKPLSIQLPDAFAAVPALAQLDGGGGAGGVSGGGRRRGSSNRASGGSGGGTQALGGGMGGVGGVGGMSTAARFFSIPPEKTGQFKVLTVCLEHDKACPRPAANYRICPIAQFTDRPAVHEICRMLGRGELNQRVAQVAAWHLNNNMSWEELIAEQYKFPNGMRRPYFSREEIQLGMRAVSLAVLAVEKPRPKSQSPSLSQYSQK